MASRSLLVIIIAGLLTAVTILIGIIHSKKKSDHLKVGVEIVQDEPLYTYPVVDTPWIPGYRYPIFYDGYYGYSGGVPSHHRGVHRGGGGHRGVHGGGGGHRGVHGGGKHT
jgi:hypothetical protein